MKFEFTHKEKHIDRISEKNYKFTCEYCRKEIYGKKAIFSKEHNTKNTLCLSCFIKSYKFMENYDEKKYGGNRGVTKEDKKIYGKIIKEIKKKYAIDLVALEL